MQKSYYRQIPLAPLGSDAIRALLGDLLGHDASTQRLADDIHACTGGNPFFIEEVVRGLIESAAAPRIEEVLATADRLIAETGACNLTPFVLVERAALAELRGDARAQEAHLRHAHDAFTQMGATGLRARRPRHSGS